MLRLESLIDPINSLQPKKKLKKIILSSTLGLGLFTTILYNPPHYKQNPDYIGPKKRPVELYDYYNYPKDNIIPNIEIITNEKYSIKKIEFQSSKNFVEPNNIKIHFYEQKKSGKYPTILVLPISGGIDYSVTNFADYFASNGFNAAIVKNVKKEKEKRNSEYLERFLKQHAINNMQALDYLEKQDRVDSENLGVFGISLGGLNGTILTGIDKRIKASVLIMAGGSMANIFCYSNEDFIKKPRDKLLKENITIEQIHNEISNNVRTDPLKLAPYIDARNTLMYIAYFDNTVPKITGDKLWETMGKPELYYILTGHYSSIIYLPKARMDSLKFFKRKLSRN